jgi:two-component system, sensor histidine kinase
LTAILSQPDLRSDGVAAGDILVVDDNAANLLAMEAALEPLGVRVVRAQSGEEALRLLLEHDFALILLDVQMPSLGGFDTARLIRERGRSRHTPIIFVTAHGREEQDVLAAYKLGAVDFLFKPVVVEILQSKVGVFVELQRRTAQVTRQSEQLRAHEHREHERTLEEERRRWDEEALRRKVEEMAEADRRKDEFLAVLGHELRNPLSAIVLGCDMLSRKLASASGPDQGLIRTLDRIDRQAHHLRRLVDDLLDLARINSGKIELKRASTSVQYIIEQAVATTLPVIEARGHHVNVEVPSETVTLWADPVRLIQVVANLLHNAARYTKEGGSISVTCVRRNDDGLIEIRVSDNGVGMAPDLLPRVFDIFVQEQPNGAGQGLGLGLTIVKRLVAMHQGTVTAASQGPGRGSTFTVTLPLDEGGASEAGADTRAGGARAALNRSADPLLVVLVEDNQDIRESMKELLTELGHTVHSAADGASGAELILRVQPDVAIVDIGLPILDGCQVATRVRSQSGGERVRLVAMTGYGQESDRRRAHDAGFDAFLVKPADTAAVIEILSSQQGASAEPLSAQES